VDTCRGAKINATREGAASSERDCYKRELAGFTSFDASLPHSDSRGTSESTDV